ncbi:hypothetical protein [Novosphingobium pokkalii]|uniref:hypothetical protein n=1 Tax=Novosphingobium pokkalii TaxID=1770194 RepID=UPI0019C2F4E4|nr:hypothetical protein [Novosphingobium pokkalii]GHC97296.1 hypothetical protein GCM10019060_27990 [Novosphingobium pokkalii]
MNSDQLGNKGESRFPELCTDADLIPNKSSWDRKGWDYVVDWKFNGSSPLDSRPTPLSCLVQLKTVWTGAKSVKLRLSSLEHLAKDLKPTFLFVLEVDDALDFVGARLAHLEGELLAHVLEALRKASFEGKAPNKIDLHLQLERWFEAIPATGMAARAAFEQAIGQDMGAYAITKQRQLKELGFSKDRLTMTTSFEVEDEDAVFDAFLGLRTISNVSVKMQETRFGLALPLPGTGAIEDGELEITPQPFDRCEVSGRDTGDGREFRFQGDVYGLPAPMLAAGRFRFLVRTPMFRLHIGGTVGDRTSMKISLNLETERIAKLKVSAAEWARLHGFLVALGRNRLELTVRIGKSKPPIVSTVTTQIDPETVGQWAAGERITAAADRALAAAGWPATKLSLQGLVQASKELNVLDALINRPESLSPMNFIMAPKPGGPTIAWGRPEETLYFNLIDLGNHLLAYVATIDLVPEPDGARIRWTGSNYRFRDVARIKATEAAYKRFIADTQRRTGIQGYFAKGTVEEDEADEA